MALRARSRLFKSAVNEWKQCNRSTYSAPPVLSYYHNPGEEPTLYLTIGQLATNAAHRWPDADVFVSVQYGTRLTFSQAEEQASKLAAGLLDLGLVPGDRLAVCSPNSVQWFVTAIAAAKAGLILVSMNPAFKAQELNYCLKKVGVRALITEESYKKQHYYGMMGELIPELENLPHGSAIKTKQLSDLNFVIVNTDKKLPGIFRFSDVADKTDNLTALHTVQQRLRPEQNANIQFTSGTTGNPKAVPLSHFNLINNSYYVGKRNGLKETRHKILAQSPFFHVLGYISAMLSSLNFGSSMVLPSPTFNVIESAKAIKKEKCTMMVGTPTMYVDLCSHVASLSPEERSLHQSPELALSGGALCLPELFRKMKDTFACQRVVSIYGLTETTAVVFQSTPEDTEYLMTSTVGKVCEHVEAKVVDTEGLSVPMGTPGELWIRSYNNMSGYWEDPKSTEAITTPDRWIKTGDLFVLTEDGYGQVVGRIKDMIIRGGENISPKEIEEFLITHSDILDAQVYGIKDERLGEEVGCSLRVKPGVEVSVQQIKDFCKGKIAHYKVPKYVEVVDEFPKTGSGKIQKFKLKQNMEKKLGLLK